jgi:hypothetical protein
MNKSKLTEDAIFEQLEKDVKKAVLNLAKVFKRDHPEDGETFEDFKESAAEAIDEILHDIDLLDEEDEDPYADDKAKADKAFAAYKKKHKKFDPHKFWYEYWCLGKHQLA